MKKILSCSLLIGILFNTPVFAANASEYCSAAYQLTGETKAYSDARCNWESGDTKFWSCIYKLMRDDGKSMGYAKGYCVWHK